jgi:hypothetical protein
MIDIDPLPNDQLSDAALVRLCPRLRRFAAVVAPAEVGPQDLVQEALEGCSLGIYFAAGAFCVQRRRPTTASTSAATIEHAAPANAEPIISQLGPSVAHCGG